MSDRYCIEASGKVPGDRAQELLAAVAKAKKGEANREGTDPSAYITVAGSRLEAETLPAYSTNNKMCFDYDDVECLAAFLAPFLSEGLVTGESEDGYHLAYGIRDGKVYRLNLQWVDGEGNQYGFLEQPA